ncbi:MULTISPECIES: carboxymuconolactone decarboxylase family protein [unclassified Streptomyces]|uniref:carboxymuconolactone decarboxylase family protein n=1 Tax=unclassified Streptomyces TaxID=2593676 RepID=UPI0038160CE8
MDDPTDRLARGRAMMHLLSPRLGGDMTDNLREVAPGFEELLLGFAFADVWARTVLPLRERALVRLGALTALGAPVTATRANIDSALHAGLGREEVSEAILQTLPYAGFPHAITALEILRELVEPVPGRTDPPAHRAEPPDAPPKRRPDHRAYPGPDATNSPGASPDAP